MSTAASDPSKLSQHPPLLSPAVTARCSAPSKLNTPPAPPEVPPDKRLRQVDVAPQLVASFAVQALPVSQGAGWPAVLVPIDQGMLYAQGCFDISTAPHKGEGAWPAGCFLTQDRDVLRGGGGGGVVAMPTHHS